MKKYYLLINPKGGHKKGLEIFEKVKPVFLDSKVDLTVLHTEYAGHAFDYAKTLDFTTNYKFSNYIFSFCYTKNN